MHFRQSALLMVQIIAVHDSQRGSYVQMHTAEHTAHGIQSFAEVKLVQVRKRVCNSSDTAEADRWMWCHSVVWVYTGCPLRLPIAALAGDPLHEWRAPVTDPVQDVLVCSKDVVLIRGKNFVQPRNFLLPITLTQ